jgi:hypothetical protein
VETARDLADVKPAHAEGGTLLDVAGRSMVLLRAVD